MKVASPPSPVSPTVSQRLLVFVTIISSLLHLAVTVLFDTYQVTQMHITTKFWYLPYACYTH